MNTFIELVTRSRCNVFLFDSWSAYYCFASIYFLSMLLAIAKLSTYLASYKLPYYSAFSSFVHVLFEDASTVSVKVLYTYRKLNT